MAQEKLPTQHFMNDASEIVQDSLVGLVFSNGKVSLNKETNVIYRKDISEIKSEQVTILSGGGSGHEPSHSSLVGKGMLSGAVNGFVFASPSVHQIYNGLELVLSEKGTVLVVKKYTGDLLNFGLAMELLLAKNPRAKLEMVVVDDDVGINLDGSLVGRRGLAGTVLVHKLVGGLADLGYGLDAISSEAKSMVSNLGTIGISLDRCQVPANHHQKATDGPNPSIEFGLGIHNEPGYETVPWDQCDALVGKVLDRMVQSSNSQRDFKLSSQLGQVILINNLGGTSKLEEGVITKSVIKHLQTMGIVPELIIVGTFMTSLNMHGFSITALSLPKLKQELWLQILTHKVGVPTWNGANLITKQQLTQALQEDEKVIQRQSALTQEELEFQFMVQDPSSEYIRYVIGCGCHTLLTQIDNITHYDQISGDGDCGLTMQSAATAVLNTLKPNPIKPSSIQYSTTHQLSQLVLGLVRVLDTNMGGSSGALFRIFLLGLVKGLTQVEACQSLNDWQTIFKVAIDTLYSHTPARIGDRTLIDGIAPFVNHLLEIHSSTQLNQILELTKAQVEGTKSLVPRLGRSAYQNPTKLIEANIPDPGAFAVLCLISGIVQGL